MASKAFASTALLLISLNLLFFSLVSSHDVPSPPPKPSPLSSLTAAYPSCPRDALKFSVCANVLQGLINVQLGNPPKEQCCSLLEGLADLEAAVCLCTAIKANILGISLNIPVDLSLLLNYCGKKVPACFKCA